MTQPNRAEALRDNRADSLARRPPGPSPPDSQPGQYVGRAKLIGAYLVEIKRVVEDPNQPRKTFPAESIDRLADSFRARGQLVPILARYEATMDLFVIVDGGRRFRAAKIAGLTDIAMVDVTKKPADEILEIQLVTNALREDVRPIEQALAYRQLMERRGYSLRQLGERLSVDHSSISKALALLDDLAPTVQAAVDAGEIGPAVAYEISRVKDRVEQVELAARAKAGDLPRDELRERIAKARPAGKGRGSKARSAKLPTSWIDRRPGGVKVTVEAKRGLGPMAIVEALRGALATAQDEAEVEPTG